jgi:hypothetical protein
MSKLLSQRLAGLRHKLRPAEHSGQYFSADDVAGFMAELQAIQREVAALEDRVAGQRRSEPVRPVQLTMPLSPTPIGTLIFVPAGA